MSLPAAAPQSFPAAPPRASKPVGALLPIVIDGAFDDWDGAIAVVDDPAGDAAGAQVDLGAVWVRHDVEFVYISFETGAVVNLQALDGSVEILLDLDAVGETGVERHGFAGAEAAIVFSPHAVGAGGPGQGASMLQLTRESARPRSPYDVGLVQAPTCAAPRFEVRVRRGNGFLEGPRVRGAVAAIAPGGGVADVTATFELGLDGEPIPAPPRVVDLAAERAADILRVVDWNVQYGQIFHRAEVFARVLGALRPDVLILQELHGEDPEIRMRAWLEEHLPGGGKWTVVMADDARSRLRCAIASRLPLEPVPRFSDSTERRGRPFPAAVVRHGERRLLAVSVHLPCCGRRGDARDEARRRDAARLRDALRAHLASHEIDGVVVAGDFNLVGGREPLDLLIGDAVPGVHDLAPARLLRPDGRDTITWRDPGEPFVPGRLDFVLFSSGTLQPTRGFVFDTECLDPGQLERLGVRRTDTTGAADHLPLVFDVGWR